MTIGKKRKHNSNVEGDILKKNLLKHGYSETLADKAVKEVYDLATTNSWNLYHRNKLMYSLLRYGIRRMKTKWVAATLKRECYGLI